MSALDAAMRLQLREEIKRIQAQFSSTMIYITHDQEEAFALSDRIMVMDNGTIQQLDTPEVIIANPANDYVREFVINNLRLKIDSLTRHIHPEVTTLGSVMDNLRMKFTSMFKNEASSSVKDPTEPEEEK
jgi:ABC-type proline/glycine betaine transport system ATPase subunit